MLRRVINNIGLIILTIFVIGISNGCQTNSVQKEVRTNRDNFNLDAVKEFITRANLEQDIVFRDNNFSTRVIGKYDNIDVVEYISNYNTFTKIMDILGEYYTEEMVELELYKMYYVNIYGKIGGIAASGEPRFNIEDKSKFRMLVDEKDKKVVGIQVFDDFGNEKEVEYILKKFNDEKWKIVEEKGYFDNYRNPPKMKYFIDWTSIETSSQSGNYTSTLLQDGKLDTAWAEVAKENGIGEWIKFHSSIDQDISGIEIINGYSKSNSTYTENNRVKRLRVEFSDRSSLEKELKDNAMLDLQKVEFGKTVKTKYIKITILDVYRGSKYQDTCISEIRVF